MEILKYLDVLIGLAVVMVLLSPLVSAFTQFWMWLTSARAGRLQVGLTNLILELNGNPFEGFDAAEISGLAPGAAVTFTPPAPAVAVTTNASDDGVLLLKKDIAMALAAHGGDLRPSLSAAGTAILLRSRGSGEDWQIASAPTDPKGVATINYKFPGTTQFASYHLTANTPAGAALTITIDSGDYKGVQLTQTGNVYAYPVHIRPVPPEHALTLHLTRGGFPVAATAVTLTFLRNPDFDQTNPLPGPLSFSEKEAETVAESVLLHPLVAQPKFWGLNWKWRRKGEVVEREELIRLLLGFAANPGVKPELVKLRGILAANDVPDPARAVADIRDAAQHLELTEAGAAAHDRFTKAILLAAQSSFVGLINNWFDHVMDRTTAEYKSRAQLVTVLGALLVATLVQLDSIDLLKRLSSDDKLRESLVQQAGLQQSRLDEQAKASAANQDEIQSIKAKRDEIEGNLAKLRDPQLAILPDHFLWQRLPQARLMRNAGWAPPYSRRLELVVGGSVYALQPEWTADPLSDIETAIRNSAAPLKTSRDKERKQYTVTGPDVDKLHLTLDGIDRLSHGGGLAQAALKPEEKIGNETFYLLTGYDNPVTVPTANGVAGLATAIPAKSGAVAVVPGDTLTLRAASAETRWIELRRRAADHSSNVLQDAVFVGGTAHFDDLLFTGAKHCAIGATSIACNPAAVEEALKPLGFKVTPDDSEHLVIASRRLGGIQLRSTPGKPETNMLNAAVEWSCKDIVCFDSDLFWSSWRGVVLTWILLSLGAPFWYDALKDLLKLRSTVAKKEEDARTDRQTNDARSPAKG